MMRIPCPWKRGVPLVVLIFDGTGWRGLAMRRRGDEWVCEETASDPVRNGRLLPKAMLDFATRVGACRLRVLLSADVQTLSLSMPEDLTEEEMQTVIAHEAEAELGLDARAQRFASSRADLFDMGGGHDALTVSAIDRSVIERFSQDAAQAGMRLDGVGALEQAVLFQHAQHDPSRRLLVVRGQTAFYAVPAGEVQPFLLTILPLGTAVAADAAVRERRERALERLAAHDALPLNVVVCGPDTPDVREEITPWLGNPCAVTFESLDALLPGAARASTASRVGGIDAGCALIGMPPPPRDPHRHGTVILLLTVLLTATWIGQRTRALQTARTGAETRLAEWEALEQARKRAAAESDGLRKQQETLRSRSVLLERRDPLPPALLPVLDALARHMPPYSRLISITAEDSGGIEIVGLTYWQDGLSQLDEALRRASSEAGFTRDFTGMETIEGRRAQRFRFHIRPGEGRP